MFVSLSFLLVGIFDLAPEKGARYKLPHDEKDLKRAKLHFFLTRVLPFNRNVLEKIGLYKFMKDRLDAARLNFSPIEFINFKILLTVGFFILATILLRKVNFWSIGIPLVLGYIVPEIWLRRRITKYREAIARALPDTIDLLGLCVEAGLDFTMAVKWVKEKTTGNPMVEEFGFVLEEIRWGKSRSQALKDMSKRLNIPEVSSFVQTLVQAERMGTPVSEAFMILSEDTRMRRFQRGERFALKAPIKILVPLIFCILPVIAIIIGGPIFLQFMNTKLF